MKKVLITGGAGFIGSNCANTLFKKGYDVVVLDNLSLGWESNLKEGVDFIKGNVCSFNDLDKVGPVDYVIHLAASSSSPMFESNLVDSVQNNINGHLQVLEFARKYNVDKVLYASTSSVYGNSDEDTLNESQNITPPNFYAVTKHCQEELSHVYSEQYGLEQIGFRFMSVYGQHEEHKGKFANLVSQFIWGMEMDKSPVIYGDGSQTRDFVNVNDVVSAFLLALETEKRFGSGVFNIGTGSSVSFTELVTLINETMGKNIEPSYINNPLGSSYIKAQLADITKISSELGFTPYVSLEQGVQDLIKFRENNPVKPVSLSF